MGEVAAQPVAEGTWGRSWPSQLRRGPGGKCVEEFFGGECMEEFLNRRRGRGHRQCCCCMMCSTLERKPTWCLAGATMPVRAGITDFHDYFSSLKDSCARYIVPIPIRF